MVTGINVFYSDHCSLACTGKLVGRYVIARLCKARPGKSGPGILSPTAAAAQLSC